MDIGTDLPITDEGQISLDIDARRAEQGLDYFPFNGSMDRFYKEGPEQHYTKENAAEVLRIVSSWYVKKNNAYRDVKNLRVKYQPHDIKQVIVQRMIENFPCWRLSDQGWRDFFKLLLDPPVNNVNPEASIPVWSGQQIFVPGERQKIIFSDGTASISTWVEPKYRSAAKSSCTAFDEFARLVGALKKQLACSSGIKAIYHALVN